MTKAMHLNILGTRGIPAAHGGFETFAERLALYLVSQGYSVTVYCQTDGPADLTGRVDTWKGIERVHFGTKRFGALGTMEFDLKCARHVLGQPGVDLVLGYNTAVFNLLQKLYRRKVYMNMDGIEWKRKKWSMPAKLWLIINEILGANLCDTPIADHPEIGRHVSIRTIRKPVVIPYGADVVNSAEISPVHELGLKRGQYFISIARIEPENSILEIVEAFRAAEISQKLVVLGKFDPDNSYHRIVRQSGRGKILYPGGIYEDNRVKSLRFHARAYIHGHQVGGTNPSLVEALGAGNAVIAHDNKFNRWTAGQDQRYFSSVQSCCSHIKEFASDDIKLFAAKRAARYRHDQDFIWDKVMSKYQSLMLDSPTAAQIAAE